MTVTKSKDSLVGNQFYPATHTATRELPIAITANIATIVPLVDVIVVLATYVIRRDYRRANRVHSKIVQEQGGHRRIGMAFDIDNRITPMQEESADR